MINMYIKFINTNMTSFTNSPKSDPADIIHQVLNSIKSNANEVLTNNISHHVRAELSKPIKKRILN